MILSSICERASRRSASRAFSSLSRIWRTTPLQLGQGLLLRHSQRHLVGDLEEVAHDLGPLAVEAAHGKPDLGHPGEDLLHPLGQDQGRKVDQDGGAHPRADVGRAGGEIAETPRRTRTASPALERVVEAADRVPGLLELHPALQALEAQVVLLVDHDAERLVRRDGEARDAAPRPSGRARGGGARAGTGGPERRSSSTELRRSAVQQARGRGWRLPTRW